MSVQNALMRDGPTRGRSTACVQVPRRREASQEVQPVYTFISFTEKCAIHTTTTTDQQTLWKRDAWNGIANVTKITSVRTQQLDEKMSAWQTATGGPTTLTRQPGRSLVVTSAVATRRLQRMQRPLFLSSSPCLLPLPLGLD